MNKDKIQLAAQKIKEADAILVGAGSGLSSACGYNHYHFKGSFEEKFSDFYEQYGYDSLMKGFYHVYSTPEQQWAFYARYIQFMRNAPIGQPYKDLYEILKDNNYFVLTTNVDMQFSKLFPEEKVMEFQGDFRFLQCSQPCHDEIYENSQLMEEMVQKTENLAVPEELLPRCPKCGWRMVPWVQDDTFLQGKKWHRDRKRYIDFLETYHDKKMILLELGVGDMTPAIIELPFWKMTGTQKNTYLLNVNLADTTPPLQLKDKMTYFKQDIGLFLKELREEYKKL